MGMTYPGRHQTAWLGYFSNPVHALHPTITTLRCGLIAEHEDGAKGVSRRNFLRGAGAGVIAAGSVAASWAARADATATPAPARTPGVDYDVIAAGGGFAGVTAARNAGHSGISVLRIER